MSRNLAQSKSIVQVRHIFGLARQCSLSEDLLRDTVESVTKRTRSIAALTSDEANLIIAHLQSKADKQTPRRTVQYRRRRAGAKQIATASPSHLELMRSLARTRSMSDEGLEQLSTRIIKHYPPRTTAETNKVIEALKAMNRRESFVQ
jgi:hypothetical protein